MKTIYFHLGCAALLLSTVIGCRSTRPAQAERTVMVDSRTQPTDRGGATGPEHIHGVVDRDPTRRDAPMPPPPPPPAAMVDQFVGQTVRVQFRRDALGLVADAPTSPLNEGLPKRPVYLDGTLKQVGHDGAMLDAESRTIWIPWSSILLIESPHD